MLWHTWSGCSDARARHTRLRCTARSLALRPSSRSSMLCTPRGFLLLLALRHRFPMLCLALVVLLPLARVLGHADGLLSRILDRLWLTRRSHLPWRVARHREGRGARFVIRAQKRVSVKVVPPNYRGSELRTEGPRIPTVKAVKLCGRTGRVSMWRGNSRPQRARRASRGARPVAHGP